MWSLVDPGSAPIRRKSPHPVQIQQQTALQAREQSESVLRIPSTFMTLDPFPCVN